MKLYIYLLVAFDYVRFAFCSHDWVTNRSWRDHGEVKSLYVCKRCGGTKQGTRLSTKI